MGLPTIPALEALLGSLTISQPQNSSDYKSVVAVEQAFGSSNTKTPTVVYPEYKLWYQDSPQFTFDALTRKLRSELEKTNHPHNEGIIKAILAAYCLEPKRKDRPIDYLNKILDSIVSIELSQIFILPFSLDDFSCSFGSFRIQNFDGERFSQLEYRCKKAGCDYFDRYKDDLKGKLAIQKTSYSVKIIQYWKDLVRKINCEYGSIWQYSGNNHSDNIIYNYFEQISNDYANKFWLTFEKEQHLLTAAGANFFDERSLKQFPFGTFVSIFLKFQGDSYGYGVPLTKGIFAFNWLGGDKKINKIKDRLKSEFDTDIDDDKISIPQTIQQFISFFGKAKRNLLDEQFNESFLNFVIALDLVFGEKGASTKSISERVALITFKKLANNFLDQKKKLKDIYDARSKYVHECQTVETKLLEEVEVICQEVFFCMLRHRNYLQNEEDLKKWQKKIDFLVTAIDAEELQPDSKYEQIGIWVK
ncbi:hypothetical protein VF14_08185 [Nostoc linckia z18]|uniref:Apea-like HEPN domain-containing protein n=2 Tax=Nostoc linckia TaxID=92942 RepID=A0A9Q6EM98_NOSLI|nr:HEPN domain-containing protein [Nostoc linckia]PHK33385.1 hypothetical protein VF12_25465 [Nostoc linckia z15]PHK47169.1 hypothetical protein VF13_06540 [Nostoc linckia z16]PHJ63870.1 hypothetical protein VF02_13810 [Nostoc linckia z1]PHJ69440.1 hypothetical protein VF05_13445 [Nostoc linckia z3]PHJ74723.1 hypothetical protein VF03_12890 [Nostoc linckia z2]